MLHTPRRPYSDERIEEFIENIKDSFFDAIITESNNLTADWTMGAMYAYVDLFKQERSDLLYRYRSFLLHEAPRFSEFQKGYNYIYEKFSEAYNCSLKESISK